MKKRFAIIFALVMLLGLFAGCGKNSEDGYKLYYLNMEMTRFVVEHAKTEATTTEGLVQELLQDLQEEPKDDEARRTIVGFGLNGYVLNGNYLTLDFNSDYYNLGVYEEVLTRAALVKTMAQIKDVTYVSITVDGAPLVDASGVEIGIMMADSFVENPGDSINSTAQTTLTLYFASSDGFGLKKETRTVHYSSNISMDKLVVEQLLAGPKTSGLQGIIPSGTRLVTVSTVDGICYVSLSENFKNQNPEISEAVVLYSIVNSLTELPDVDKVQISINGDTTGKCRYEYDLSAMYEANLDLLNAKKPDKSEPESDKAGDKTEESSAPAENNTTGEPQAEAGVSSDLKTEKTEN